MREVLITGGAGFIGSHLADRLLEHGYAVRVLDNLCRQVHPQCERPAYLDDAVELQVGDVRDAQAVETALKGMDAVVHLAAAVGVGQSMYEIDHYVDVNNRGTAVLLEALTRRPVQKLVVASSMSIYGEGLYRNRAGEIVEDAERSLEQLRRGKWEPCDIKGALQPMPTPETKRPDLSSVYALTKYDQERLCLMTCRAYNIPVVALRFFNVYGPRQALSNPYTGVLAIFAARLLNGRAPIVYEDGRQRRDFVSVYDIAAACQLALESTAANGSVFNIGSGQPRTVKQVAAALANVLEQDTAPEITGNYRVGDIRHCFADIRKAAAVLGYRPQVQFESGLEELALWLEGQTAEDRVDEVLQELTVRGLRL